MTGRLAGNGLCSSNLLMLLSDDGRELLRPERRCGDVSCAHTAAQIVGVVLLNYCCRQTRLAQAAEHSIPQFLSTHPMVRNPPMMPKPNLMTTSRVNTELRSCEIGTNADLVPPGRVTFC